ncbi:protein TolQ [Pantoea sp. Tr-811]|uniref:protein TolQ n=1 Tax=unclassified Pantoea TaxID=2630326 RepID=UPI0014244129|nr:MULTISPECIES: protein TolQ [unclassified Pantoea]NIE78284.1 protein TolQ [Pantoea sp. Ap-967]NIF28203.1 protein TolQ [Pantoea sp. Tr-811]
MQTPTPLEHTTLWSLVSDASLVVQAVMLCLVLASLLSWYLIIQRGTRLRRSQAHSKAFLKQFRENEVGQLYQGLKAQQPHTDAGLQRIFVAGYQAFQQLQPGQQPDSVLEGVERGLLVAIAEQEERLEQGLPFLATVGSVSPYIGLFGTVWGIMNAFLGLSQVQQATLSTVAPGIAEALIATAIGLFAAIPAVMAYNRFSASSQTLIGRYYAFGNELQGRLQRRLQGQAGSLAAAA